MNLESVQVYFETPPPAVLIPHLYCQPLVATAREDNRSRNKARSRNWANRQEPNPKQEPAQPRSKRGCEEIKQWPGRRRGGGARLGIESPKINRKWPRVMGAQKTKTSMKQVFIQCPVPFKFLNYNSIIIEHLLQPFYNKNQLLLYEL